MSRIRDFFDEVAEQLAEVHYLMDKIIYVDYKNSDNDHCN